MEKELDDNEIRLLPFPDNFREKIGVYLGGNQDYSVAFREIIDNACDEVYACPTCNNIIIDQNWGGSGLHLVADTGRGLSIKMSKDIPTKTQAHVALTEIHSGTKFFSTGNVKTGTNGLGIKAAVSTSQNYFLLSKITEDNFDKSVPVVLEAWKKYGPRQRKDLYYILIFEKGHLQYEGADRIGELEKIIFEKYPSEISLPSGYSTITLSNADPTIYEKVSSKIPIKNLEYFSLIQEKFFNRKVNVIINGTSLRDSFKPYKFEFTKTIIPKDSSKNPQLMIYVTYEPDDDLGVRESMGSVNGLSNESGVHINYIEQAFETALKSEYKITHKYTLNGLKLVVVLLADSITYDSQTKVRVRAIDKVKASDFTEVAKEFVRQFRKNSDIWEKHVERLDALADSMKSFSAKEKSLKMINDSKGASFFKSKKDLPKGFAEATAPASERMKCELFLCFPADEKLLLVDDPKGRTEITFGELEAIMNGPEDQKEEFYTLSTTGAGKSRKTKIVQCHETKKTQRILRIGLNDGNTFRCTPDHKIKLIDGTWKPASELTPKDILMYVESENKKSVSVSYIQTENIPSEIPVYCLEVQDKEHNFPLWFGLVVSNCEG